MTKEGARCTSGGSNKGRKGVGVLGEGREVGRGVCCASWRRSDTRGKEIAEGCLGDGRGDYGCS